MIVLMDAPFSLPGYHLLGPLHEVEDGYDARYWRAVRLADDLQVVVCCLDDAEVARGEGTSRISRAAQIARIRHPHVLRVHDVVPLPAEPGCAPRIAFATAVLDGEPLAELLARRGHIKVGELVTLMCPLTDAVRHLHAEGVMHRALSAHSVSLTEVGMPMLIDVAPSALADSTPRPELVAQGFVAPEIVEGFEASPESDVYALGALMWRAIVGEGPGWIGAQGDLGELAAHVPPLLQKLITSCLSPDPADRPAVEELGDVLRAAAEPDPIERGGLEAAADLPRRLRAMASRPAAHHPDRRRQRSTRLGVGRSARSRSAAHRAPVRPFFVAACSVVALVSFAFVMMFAPSGRSLESRAGVVQSGQPIARDEAPALPGEKSAAPPHEDSASEAPEQDIQEQAAEQTAGPTVQEAETGEPSQQLASTQDLAGASQSELQFVVQELLDARARAWESGTPSELTQAHAPGSAAWAADASALRELTREGARFDHVEFIASGVEILPEEFGSADEAEVLMRATIERTPMTMTTDSGAAEDIEATTEEVVITVQRVEDQWRLVAWR